MATNHVETTEQCVSIFRRKAIVDGAGDVSFATWKGLRASRSAMHKGANKRDKKCLLSITGALTPNRVSAQVKLRRLGLATTVASKAIGPGSAGHPKWSGTT